MSINLDNIPRTIDLVRADASLIASGDVDASIPEGFPILLVLDQTLLPKATKIERIVDWREVVCAIKQLKVRGAPAIGIAGAAAVALCAAELCATKYRSAKWDADWGVGRGVVQSANRDVVQGIDRDIAQSANHDTEGGRFDQEAYLDDIRQAAQIISKARPTAVNLVWAVDRCLDVVKSKLNEGLDPLGIADCLYGLVRQMMLDDENANRAIGAFGSQLLPKDSRILTHCNAGSLATSFYGTALGVIYSAACDKGVARVYADETRPVCQGSRLTVWELAKAGVPVTLICDDMAASVLSQGRVDAIVVGADRIAANGDTANKIGTLSLAILAREFGIPFYIAAPTSTIDVNTMTGDDIAIEQRDSSEVLRDPIEGVDVYNPAFDVTPARYISAIITEFGVFKPCEIMQSLTS